MTFILTVSLIFVVRFMVVEFRNPLSNPPEWMD